MPSLDTLVADVFELFNPEKTHVPNEDNLTAFANNLKTLVRERLSSREPAGTLRFSSLGRGDRALWYDCHPGPAEPLTSKTYFKFLYGDIIEQMLVFLIKEAGHTVEMEQAEVEVDGVLGHIDAIVDGVVVDVKSASPYGYQKFLRNGVLDDDPFGYVQQLAGYSDVLNPGKHAAWIAFDKVSGDVCVAELSASVIADNKPGPRIEHLKEVIADETPPAYCHEDVEDGKSGNRKLAVGCSYCVVPETPILKSDLTWAPAVKIEIGQKIIGFDEYGVHKLRHTDVLDKTVFQAPCYHIITDKGEITVSEDHTFLSKTSSNNRLGWRNPSQLKEGYYLKFFGKPWETLHGEDAGYLRGFLDGEGCWSGHSLSWAQRPGIVADYVLATIQDGCGINTLQRYVKSDSDCVSWRVQGKLYNSLRVAGQLRPLRLLPKAIASIEGYRDRDLEVNGGKILAINYIGEQTVVGLETGSGTLFTNGFYSHNCRHKFRCRDGIRVFAYSGAPRFLTKVVKEPEVPEITGYRAE